MPVSPDHLWRKAKGALEIWARRKSEQFLVATIVMMAVVSACVPFLGRQIEARWFSWPNILVLVPVPLLTAFVAYRIHRSINDGHHTAPFLLSILMFLLGFLGLVISLFPYIVPPSMTIWQAANTVDSQMFALVGYSLALPITFAYTAYAYYVFRGKVAEEITGGGYG